MSDLNLNAHEARVLGVLIEKAFTTPDNYPLSLNAATSGCNQKSNRDPVVDYLEDEVYIGLTGLCHKLLAGKAMQAGSRVEKFRHSANQALGLSDGGLAVLAELLMRGPQTPGELRARANRMVAMPAQSDLAAFVDELIAKGYAQHVGPKPGSRAGRVAQQLVPDLHPLGAPAVERPTATAGAQPGAQTHLPQAAGAVAPAGAAPGLATSVSGAGPVSHGLPERVETLERELRWLKGQLSALAQKLGEALDDPGC